MPSNRKVAVEPNKELSNRKSRRGTEKAAVDPNQASVVFLCVDKIAEESKDAQKREPITPPIHRYRFQTYFIGKVLMRQFGGSFFTHLSKAFNDHDFKTSSFGTETNRHRYELRQN